MYEKVRIKLNEQMKTECKDTSSQNIVETNVLY
jgi:hypothetical protein